MLATFWTDWHGMYSCDTRDYPIIVVSWDRFTDISGALVEYITLGLFNTWLTNVFDSWSFHKVNVKVKFIGILS